ncbi:hypothetical protein F5B19DRAFT_504534 [Rostrohypoxylon terebratum]|nr:hypothetical protein F5B19DRAFT_504534 [Rostrohypoxylon terebratum]
MRFTYFLSAFLATLAIASPISSGADVAEGADLIARTGKTGTPTDTPEKVVKTPEFEALEKVHPNLQDKQYYWVYQKDKLGAKILDGDTESLTDLEKLQKNLGFEHIGVVVGQVVYTTKTSKKEGKTTTKSFKAFYYHLTKNKDKNNAAVVHWPVWETKKVDFSKSFLENGGQTNSKGADKAKTIAKNYISSDPKHVTYNVDDNNCNTFAQAVRAAFS